MCLYFTENIPFVDFPQTLSSSFIIVCWWRCQNNKVISNIISLFKVKLYLLSETSKLQTSSSADFVSDVVRNEQLWTLTLTTLSLDHWLPCWQHLPEKYSRTQTSLGRPADSWSTMELLIYGSFLLLSILAYVARQVAGRGEDRKVNISNINFKRWI